MEEAPALGSASGEQQESLPLEDQITVDQFSQLMTVFHSRGRRRKGGRMPMGDFKKTLAAVLGREEGDEKISLLCSKIDVEDESCVKEGEICSYLLQRLRERDTLAYAHPLPFQGPPSFRYNSNSKETLCRLMFAPSPQRYITVSKDGMVSTWTPGLQVLQGVKMAEPGRGRGRGGGRGLKGTLWVTDCALMTNCHKLVVGTTSKELSFYDTTSPSYWCQYRIHDLSSVPLCMTYHCSLESPSSPSYLLFGDVSGSVVVLTFPQPLTGLFNTANKDDNTTQLIAYSCLSDHAPFVSLHCVPQLHPDWVRKVAYVWHNHSFLSCCGASSLSLVARDITRRRNSYVFTVRKGVICFDYCHHLGLLVTGSLDHTVRLWNPYVPSRPMATLSSHTTAVLDVTINRHLGLVFSCSQDCVLCAWDVFEHSLVQSVTIKFPFSQQSPDFGPSPLHPLPSSPLHPLPSPSLTLLCNAFIAELKLGEGSQETANQWTATSHKHPLTAALYNPHFHQVVSGCEGGEVSVWDVDSGRRVLQLKHCHGRQEITAMTLDTSGRRLVTGSHAGEIKVWNYMSSQCVKQMSVCGEGGAAGGGVGGGEEVTGIIHLVNKFLTIGWNRRITSFPDLPDVFNVRQDGSWQGEDHHKDDILCATCCPPHYLATGSFDGETKVWNLDTEKVMIQFQSITKPRPSILKQPRKASVGISKTPFWSQSSLTRSIPSRPTSRKLSAYRIKSSSAHLQHVPVDQLLFLRTRVRARHKGAAVLVSSEGGLARFWDIFGPHEPVGVFPLTEFEGDIVLSLRTDPQENHLIAGDTSGSISVFEISHYGTAPIQDGVAPDPIVRWKAHAGEILSIEYVPHDEQPLLLSASGDCTVRLWTFQGQYIGTFGQEQPWNLKTPSTFQHPSTPWGEPASALSQLTCKGVSPRPHTPHTKDAPSIATLHEEEEEEEEEGGKEGAQGNPPVQDGKLSITALTPALADKSLLGEPYKEGVKRRMADRQERRTQFVGIDLRTTERFGSLCSPFQALHVQRMEDIDVPKELSTALDNL